MDDAGYYLEDRRGRSLVRLGGLGWDIDELSALEQAAGFSVLSDPGSASPDPGMMNIDDPPYFARASISAAVGTAAVSLYWLHIAPEAVMNFVALPALILFVWFITLTKLSMPSNKEIAAMQKRAHERAVQVLAETDEILKRYPAETAPEPETDKP